MAGVGWLSGNPSTFQRAHICQTSGQNIPPCQAGQLLPPCQAGGHCQSCWGSFPCWAPALPSVFIHRQWLCWIRISVELSSTADYSNTPPAYLSTDTLEMISTKFLRKDKNPGWIIINRWLLCSTVEPPPVLGPGQPGHVQTPPGQIDHVLASPGQPGHVQAPPGCQPGNLLSTTCPQLKSPFPSRTCQIKQPSHSLVSFQHLPGPLSVFLIAY